MPSRCPCGCRRAVKGSGIYDLSEMNSEEMAGKPISGSVMDYLPVNINVDAGEAQGPFTMETLGPYDYWAIEYGYSFERDLKPLLSRVSN